MSGSFVLKSDPNVFVLMDLKSVAMAKRLKMKEDELLYLKSKVNDLKEQLKCEEVTAVAMAERLKMKEDELLYLKSKLNDLEEQLLYFTSQPSYKHKSVYKNIEYQTTSNPRQFTVLLHETTIL
ncbi:hypothetical protein STAS_06042 [Striga asiatica]|uniref:Uncharacterized protein n=1 Tax=Striga asiatica TaxID=4170 RepID=A0A5A7PBC0_STRAF|nr:hypothetical protein STAS_06042 [Striga asiatica]